MKTLFYNRNIKGKTFKRFVPFMGELFPTFSLVSGMVMPKTKEEEAVLKKFDPFLVEMKEVWEWLGTECLPGWGDPPILHKFRSCEGSLKILVGERDRLFAWNGREVPQDLAFYREDESNSFGTIAHEGYCFFRFTPEELERLKEEFPYIRWNVKKS